LNVRNIQYLKKYPFLANEVHKSSRVLETLISLGNINDGKNLLGNIMKISAEWPTPKTKINKNKLAVI